MNTALYTYSSSSPFKTVYSPLPTNAHSKHIQDLRTAAFNELRQSIQSYTDSFVLRMQLQEREEQSRKQRQAEDDRRTINELALILQTGSIHDYDYEQNGSDLWL